jgi:voltage-gated potassium channel Kch
MGSYSNSFTLHQFQVFYTETQIHILLIAWKIIPIVYDIIFSQLGKKTLLFLVFFINQYISISSCILYLSSLYLSHLNHFKSESKFYLCRSLRYMKIHMHDVMLTQSYATCSTSGS